MTQDAVRTVEFGGFGPKDPWVRLNGCTYLIGDSLRGGYGFGRQVVLTERLFRILLALAVARQLDPNPTGGWVDGAQLAATVEEVTLREGTRRFLARILRRYVEKPEWESGIRKMPEVSTHLIQYMPQRIDGVTVAHGRTRGPYRLGVPANAIKFDQESGARFFCRSTSPLPVERWDLPQALAYAETTAQQCDYFAARAAILKGLLLGTDTHDKRQRYSLVADAHHILGQYAVQLRFPEEAVRSARHARELFIKLRHPAGVVSALLTEAHAKGQMGNEMGALASIREARTLLDNSVVPSFRQIKRAECAGVTGQRYSHLHNFEAAEHNLLRGFHLAQDIDDRRQICLWAVRRADNFLRQRNLHSAERTLTEAHELFDRLGIAGMERTVLWRVTAGFAVATGQRGDAIRWTSQAKKFALAHGLDTQVDRLTTIIADIDVPEPESAE